MMRIPRNKSFSFAIIVICSILLTVFYGISLSEKMSSLLTIIEPVFDKSTPVVHLCSGELKFEGDIPYQIKLLDGVQILFEYETDSTVLDSLPKFSTLITNNAVYYKSTDKIEKVSVQNIKVDKDNIELNPVKIGLFLQKFSTILVLITGFIIFIAFLISLYLIVLVATGIGIMIDAFSDGPYSFAVLFRSAGIFMLILVLVWILFGFSTLQQLKYMLLFFLSVFIIFVYMTIRLARRA